MYQIQLASFKHGDVSLKININDHKRDRVHGHSVT